MAMPSQLLSLLVDPLCGGPLELVEHPTLGSRLFAPQAQLYFPLIEGTIPVLLADEAQHEDGSSAATQARELLARRIR